MGDELVGLGITEQEDLEMRSLVSRQGAAGVASAALTMGRRTRLSVSLTGFYAALGRIAGHVLHGAGVRTWKW